MPSALTVGLKNSLIATARAFREGDEAAAWGHFTAASAQNPHIANQIYGRLWEVMQSPNIVDFGQHAFWNQQGQTAPLSKKTQAVEDVLKQWIQQAGMTLPPAAPLPAGAIPVLMPAFFDCGLDPRFSFDGDYLLPTGQQFNWNTFCQTIRQWIAYLEFSLRAYLSPNAEERNLRQMILSLAKAEHQWTKATQFTFTKSYELPQHVFTSQREFLDQASALYQAVHPTANAPKRQYPNQLLVPIHNINKPQDESDHRSVALPGWENGDLSRCAREGYWRLRKEMYRVYNETSRQSVELDQHNLRYVPHYIFIQATEQPAQQLKIALRDYRSELSSIINDPQSARSLQSCKQRLFTKLEAFHSAWNQYVSSHELLTEVNAVFSQHDPYKMSHEYKKWKMQMSKIPFFSELHFQYTCSFYGRSHYWESEYDHLGYEALKQIVVQNFPQSANAQLLRSYLNN
jgi:hypothetical protein